MACNPELGAQFTDLGTGLAHRCLREPQLGCRHLVGAPAVAAAGPCRSQASLGALDDQRVLELRQRGKNAEYETAVCRRGVELCALADQDLQANLASGQIMEEIDQVAQVAAESIELPRHQRITLPQRLEACLQTRPIVALAGCLVLIEVPRFNTGGKECIALQVERLAAVGLRCACSRST
jgi:hypothetical protein